MTSRLVLGAANYGRLTQADVNNLLSTALELGINKIDTAHRYEDSENKIGISLKVNKGFSVNTKACPYGPELFTPAGIKSSVEESLRRLKIESLGTLFTHSIPAKYLTSENIETMTLLKKEGKIERIGFSGDGSDLSYAMDIKVFDDFQATVNIIDQSNSKIIKRVSENAGVYFKLSMAQAVWTSLEWKNRIKTNKRIRSLFNRPSVPDSWSDYCARFNRIRLEIDEGDFAASFLRFALFSGSAKQFVILGTKSQQHLRDAVQIERDLLHQEVLEVSKYEDLYARKSSPEWSAHAG
jgi:aryl-alcohol dehydrogenase-like predicted oxidoreductase